MNDSQSVSGDKTTYSYMNSKGTHVSNQGLGGGSTPYIMPRQTGTGNTRGTQNISGLLTITNPTTNKTIAIIGYSPEAF